MKTVIPRAHSSIQHRYTHNYAILLTWHSYRKRRQYCTCTQQHFPPSGHCSKALAQNQTDLVCVTTSTKVESSSATPLACYLTAGSAPTQIHVYTRTMKSWALYARVSDWKGHNIFDRSQHVRHSAYILHACIRAYTNMCHNAGKYTGPYLVKCSTTFLTLRNAKMCPFTAEVLLQQQQRADSTLSKYHTSFTEHTGQVWSPSQPLCSQH